ncbi:MAG: HAMP domain-containing protein [Deltaproteobacteria bacterium]|nr:HAMP domain-containing protein [Deltaproteobacteria bacterium]
MTVKTLAAKAIVPVALSVTGFVVMCCILLYSVMKSDMVADTVRHETNLADTIIKSARYAMLKSDREGLRNIIDNVGVQQGVAHVRIFNKKGLIMFSARPDELARYVDRKAPGCVVCHATDVPVTTMGPMEHARRYVDEDGRQVLAITAPVYNEPACYQASCHVHPPAQKVLGTLDLGLSADPLARTLRVLKGRMMLFSLMVLLITVGGVSALLRRNVFLPIRQLAEAAQRLERGDTPVELPRSSGEIGQIAAALERMSRAPHPRDPEGRG